MSTMNRRHLIQGAAAGVLASAAHAKVPAQPLDRLAHTQPQDDQKQGAKRPLHLRFAVKYGMVKGDLLMVEKFLLLKRLGFDGVELDSPAGYNREDVLRARDASGLPVHGVVDSVHWSKTLSHNDEKVRDEGRAALEGAIRDSKAYGGSSVLLVPGVVNHQVSQEQAWDRSIAEIDKVVPLAAELGIHILIENVWSRFNYVHDGPGDQSADLFAAYIDAINSPWVGMYHDLGNHCKYGKVEEWVRTFGRRTVKLDVKDWGKENGWCKIGDGDVDWAAVRQALRVVGFTGWCTAEVGGGDESVLRDIKERMDRVLRS